MVRRLLLSCSLFALSWNTSAQLLEFKGVTRLPNTVNSKSEEGMPLLAPDGKKLFFTRSLYRENEGGIYAGQDIWVSEWSVAGWKKAANSLEDINNKNNNVVSG